MPSLRTNRRRLAAGALVAAAWVAVPLATSGAQVFDEDASIDKVGWWNRLEGGVTGDLPPNPITPNIPESPVPTDSVPDDAIAVGTQTDADKVATLNIVFNVPANAQTDSLVVTLTEITDGLASTNHEDAPVVACPSIDFWPDTSNGDWNTRPAGDCAAGRVLGVRADDGTWTFDLAPIADVLRMLNNGVVFLPAGTLEDEETQPEGEPAAPGSFQLSWGGLDSDAPPSLSASFSGGTDPFATTSTITAPVTTAPPVTTPPAGGGTTGGGGGTVVSPPTGGDEPAPTTTTVAPDTGDTAAPPTEPVADQRGNTLGNLSPAVIVLILALAAALATLGLGQGPLGQPQTVHARRGAVTRTLERRGIGTHTPGS